MHEDKHPNNGQFNLALLHTAGKDPRPLSERYPYVDDSDEAVSFKNPEYQLRLFESKLNEAFSPWPKLALQTAQWIESNGPGTGYLITAYNRSEGDMAVVYVISWTAQASDYFKSKQRPEACCQCALF